MQDGDLVAVGQFNNDIEAQQAINLLAEHGIVAQINDDGGTFDLGIGELPAVEVIVVSSNFEKAQTLLADFEVDQDATCPAWTCQCGEEVDEGFFACWSCGAEYAAE